MMLAAFRKSLAPPVFEDEGDNFTARNLNVVLLSVFVSILVTMLRYLALGKFWQGSAGFIFIVTGIIVGGVYVLFQKRYIRVGSVLAVSVFTLMPFALILMSGNGIHDTAIMLLPVVVIIASLLLPWQGLVAHVLLIALGYGVIVRMEVNQNLITPFSSLTTNSDFTDALTILAMAAVMSGLMASSLRKNLSRLSDELKRRELAESDLRQQAEQMSLLYQISLALSSGENLYQALRAFVKELKRVMVVDGFHVGLYDPQTDAFSYTLFLNLGEDLQLPPRNLRESPGLTWEVILSKRTLYLPDVSDLQTQQSHNIVTVVDVGIRTYIGIPLMLESKVIGVMSVQSIQLDAYTPDQIRLLETLAAQVAITIEKARLYESERNALEQSETLRESAAVVTATLDEAEAVDKILEQLKRVVPYNSASVQLIEMDHLVIVGVSGLPDAHMGFRFPINEQEPSYPVLREQQPYILFANVQDVTPGFNEIPHEGIHSWLAVPLTVKGRIVGIIALDGHEANQFTDHHARLAVAFANQVAIALENSQLFSEVQQELVERKRAEDTLRQRDAILQAVAHAAQVFLQSSNWRESINRVLEELGQATVTSHAYIFENHVLDDGTRVTSQRYEWAASNVLPDIDNPKYQNMPLYEDGVGDWVKVLESGRSYAGNIQTLPGEISKKIQERGLKSILDVPVFVSGKWWGEIGFDDMENVREWSASEIEILEVAARMIGAAIEREQVDEAFRQNEEQHRNELEHQVVERTSQLTAANDLLKDEKIKIEKVVNEVATLRKLSDFLQSSMTIEEASKVVARHMNSLFANTNGGLYLISDGFADLTLTSSWGEFKTENVIQPNDCWGMRRGRVFVRHPSDASPACAHFGGSIPDESLCLPLMGQNEIIGMLCLQITKSENTYFTQDVQNLAVASADSIALALANLRLRERLRNQTIRDPLTGIFNRRYLEETLEREAHRAGRNNEPLCVIMFEIDDFKQYNNTFGHDAGDYVLKKIADTMRSNLRRSDFPCRYGGDEFTLLLPNTTLEDGAHRAEELRKAIEVLALSFNNQALGQVTVRLGVAAYPKHGETGEAVLKVADDASYRARAIGKNCVVVAE